MLNSSKKVESYEKVAASLSIEKFLGLSIPEAIKKICKDNYMLEQFDQEEIMRSIDFAPPFLKIKKMVILSSDRNNVFNNKGLATGILTVNDTAGHYGNSIHLAKCGQLIASAASIYLAMLFPSTAPQVVEVGKIRLSKDGILMKLPTLTENNFLIEIQIIKKKMQLVIVNSRVYFAGSVICEIDELKLILMSKESIWKAKELSATNEAVFKKMGMDEVEEFFSTPIPEHIKINYKNQQIFRKLNQQEIMETIDFTPPFLKIDKIIVFNADKNQVNQTLSLGMGTITSQDTSGHYNETIFLAMCGWLMSSAVSIHLGVLFPSSMPEVIESRGVKPIEKGMWKPSKDGTLFWAESYIIEKKEELVTIKTKIYFDKISYGIAEESKVILFRKN